MNDQPDMLWWESTADPDTGAPMVMLRWGDKAQVFDTERALATCRDVFAAAEAADADKALWTVLTKRLRLDQSTAVAALADIRAHRTTMHTTGGGEAVFAHSSPGRLPHRASSGAAAARFPRDGAHRRPGPHRGRPLVPSRHGLNP